MGIAIPGRDKVKEIQDPSAINHSSKIVTMPTKKIQEHIRRKAFADGGK